MSNFGELPFGEIPEPLKYVRPFSTCPIIYYILDITTLSNGIRVCSEKTNAQTASVGVYVGAGSRNEDLETSGAAYLLEKMLTRGTSSRNRNELGQEIEGLGGIYESKTDREMTYFSLQLFKDDLRKGVELLGDMVCNSQLNSGDLEALKEEVSHEHEDNHHRYMETTIENAHFNAYREHMIGQPVKGDRDNLPNLTIDHLRDYQAANVYGDNTLVVASGNVDHQQLVDAVESHFNSLTKQASAPSKNAEKPIFIPALLFIRDDEMVNSNVGVFYDAPSWKHEDYYGFLLLKHMFGNYRVDKHAEHLNDVRKQYNSMHVLLGDLVDVTKGDSMYMPYSDCGLFGNYFFGNEVFTRQMNYCGVCLPTIYGHFVNDVEVYRGRNHLFNSLLRKESPSQIMHEIGRQVLGIGRRVPRSEVAKRIAHLDNHQIKQLCYEWFYDAEPSFTNWGPIESVSATGSYKYFKINTMSTVTNTHHSLFQ